MKIEILKLLVEIFINVYLSGFWYALGFYGACEYLFNERGLQPRNFKQALCWPYLVYQAIKKRKQRKIHEAVNSTTKNQID